MAKGTNKTDSAIKKSAVSLKPGKNTNCREGARINPAGQESNDNPDTVEINQASIIAVRHQLLFGPAYFIHQS